MEYINRKQGRVKGYLTDRKISREDQKSKMRKESKSKRNRHSGINKRRESLEDI
jgi:hypothetical protein